MKTTTIISGNFAVIITRSGISASILTDEFTLKDVRALNPKATSIFEVHSWAEVEEHFTKFWEGRGMTRYTPPAPFTREN